MATFIKIKQIHSTISTPPDIRATIKGLGLRGPGKERILQDTHQIRGMIRKVAHLVEIEPWEKEGK